MKSQSRRRRFDATTVKFTAFVTVMLVLGAFLFLVFSDKRSGDVTRYRAVFADASGLVYYRARYYAPELGRFTQADPIGHGEQLG